MYKDVEGTSTEWDDIQRKLGNLPAKPPPSRPAPWIPAPDEKEAIKDRAWLDNKTEEELEELADDPDLDDDRFLEEYRWAYHALPCFLYFIAHNDHMFCVVLLYSGFDFCFRQLTFLL